MYYLRQVRLFTSFHTCIVQLRYAMQALPERLSSTSTEWDAWRVMYRAHKASLWHNVPAKPNQVVLTKLLIACIGPRGQTISWHHVMSVKSALTVILQLSWTYMVLRTWGKGGRGWRHHRERGNINVWSPPLPWQHYCDVWLSLVFLAPGAHQMEPPSPTQALGVNPFPSTFINRTVPWGGFAC